MQQVVFVPTYSAHRMRCENFQLLLIWLEQQQHDGNGYCLVENAREARKRGRAKGVFVKFCKLMQIVILFLIIYTNPVKRNNERLFGRPAVRCGVM